MPRHRTPIEVAEAAGAFARHPERRRARAGEPHPTAGVGDPPAHLSKDVAAAFTELVRTANPGTAFASDRVMLEIGAQLLVEYRAAPAAMPASRVAVLVSVLARFGLSPSDRARLQILPPRYADKPAKPDAGHYFTS